MTASYDVVEDARSVALEADFRARWWAEREQMWLRILDELETVERTYVAYLQAAPPPKVFTWWKRMLVRLLGGEA